MNKIKIIISYCLPAILALTIFLYGYYERTQDVTDVICLLVPALTKMSRYFFQQPQRAIVVFCVYTVHSNLEYQSVKWIKQSKH